MNIGYYGKILKMHNLDISILIYKVSILLPLLLLLFYIIMRVYKSSRSLFYLFPVFLIIQIILFFINENDMRVNYPYANIRVDLVLLVPTLVLSIILTVLAAKIKNK